MLLTRTTLASRSLDVDITTAYHAGVSTTHAHPKMTQQTANQQTSEFDFKTASHLLESLSSCQQRNFRKSAAVLADIASVQKQILSILKKPCLPLTSGAFSAEISSRSLQKLLIFNI